jgi:signal peptidase I
VKHLSKILLLVIIASITSCNSENFYIIPFKRYIIPQNGMYPTLPSKTTLWVKRKPLFNVENVRRGDIIVFYQKENDKKYDFIWRVIGVPGDKIMIKGTSVYVNDKILVHDKKKETNDQIIFLEKGLNIDYLVAYDKQPDPASRFDIEIVVPDKHFFVLGDNRDNAMDSRFKGFVPFSNVIGMKM